MELPVISKKRAAVGDPICGLFPFWVHFDFHVWDVPAARDGKRADTVVIDCDVLGGNAVLLPGVVYVDVVDQLRRHAPDDPWPGSLKRTARRTRRAWKGKNGAIFVQLTKWQGTDKIVQNAFADIDRRAARLRVELKERGISP